MKTELFLLWACFSLAGLAIDSYVAPPYPQTPQGDVTVEKKSKHKNLDVRKPDSTSRVIKKAVPEPTPEEEDLEQVAPPEDTESNDCFLGEDRNP